MRRWLTAPESAFTTSPESWCPISRRAGIRVPRKRTTSTDFPGILPRVREQEDSAEERDHIVLDPKGDVAGMGPVIDLESIGDAILIQGIVKPLRIVFQPIFVANVDRDGSVAAEISGILVDEC